MEGKVIWYASEKRYGFLLGSDGLEYFFHISEVHDKAENASRLRKGQPLSFDPAPGQPNPQASNIKIIPGALPEEGPGGPLILKKNPFTPQYPVTDPKKFAGRRSILRSAVDSMFNSRNILITGPRGIGKSSLAYQLLYMTQGEVELLHKLGADEVDLFNCISGDHRCGSDDSLEDIARGLIVNLSKDAEVAVEESSTKTRTGLDVKFFSAIEETTSARISATDVANWFTEQVSYIFSRSKSAPSGISFLIDEIDQVDPEIALGSFLKAVVEKFRLDGHVDVCFIVGGVTGTVTSLVAQHPSSRRLFERLELQTMAYEELEEVINITLEGTGVPIRREATARLISLANNFPQPLHLLGYHAFRLDTDNIIDIEDIEESKKHIVRYSLRQDYADKLENITRGAMSDIIYEIAASRSPTVTGNYLAKRLPELSKPAIAGNLGNLVQWSILEKHGRYAYSFQEPLFKIYCRWVYAIDKSS